MIPKKENESVGNTLRMSPPHNIQIWLFFSHPKSYLSSCQELEASLQFTSILFKNLMLKTNELVFDENDVSSSFSLPHPHLEVLHHHSCPCCSCLPYWLLAATILLSLFGNDSWLILVHDPALLGCTSWGGGQWVLGARIFELFLTPHTNLQNPPTTATRSMVVNHKMLTCFVVPWCSLAGSTTSPLLWTGGQEPAASNSGLAVSLLVQLPDYL
jgi:hypothetical protein